MKKVLVPIDAGAERAWRSAIAEAIQIHRQERAAIHLLNVQPRVTAHVAMFFAEGELQQIQQDAGAEDLRPARAVLDAAGVPCTSSVLVGRSAETIARAARELGCDRILMGRESAPGLAGKVFGSVGAQVRHLLGGANDCQVIGS